jgi:hypothetical protein
MGDGSFNLFLTSFPPANQGEIIAGNYQGCFRATDGALRLILKTKKRTLPPRRIRFVFSFSPPNCWASNSSVGIFIF